MSAARDRAEAAFHSAFGRVPDVIARAPGRVNLIGEHVDYNDGIVLPFAIERDVVVCVGQARSAARQIRAADHPAAPDAYVHSVAAELAAAGINPPDFELSVAGDVPVGAGLSSSAALTCATALALLGLADATLPIFEIAQLCRRAEHRAVGVQCGIMDPFTSLFARAGHAILLDTRTLEHEQVSVPDGAAFVIVDSGVNRVLAGSAYNQRVAECRAAARHLGVASLRDVSLEQVEAAAEHLGAVLYRR
ncbi:MAG TPA: galactokinase family protein, partial [Longimicrobiales bacterium]|nr:galactokinase family protein [Longimicrobiales bacterium]